MSDKVFTDRNTYLYRIFCVTAIIVAILPLSCGYIMEGGIIAEWISEVEAIAVGREISNIDSSFWLWIPGLFYRWIGNIVWVYLIWMFLIQLGTAFSAMLLFGRLFPKSEEALQRLIGVLLYLTFPYRIYISYDLADMRKTIVYMLIPLYIWAMIGICSGKKRFREVLIAAITVAAISYSEAVYFVIFMGITLLVWMIVRRNSCFLVLVGSLILFLPGFLCLTEYLLKGNNPGTEAGYHLIMEHGYRFGEFFSIYTWKNGHPGLGMGLLLCFIVGSWLRFVKSVRWENKIYRYMWLFAVFFAVMSWHYFPWDVLQRLGIWALRLISLFETPGIFWGLACSVLCISGAKYIGEISKNENKIAAVAVPIIVIMFSMGCCIYQCNTLTYCRMPMILP